MGAWPGAQPESLCKALLGSFKSFDGLSLWSMEALWSLKKLPLLALLVVVVVGVLLLVVEVVEAVSSAVLLPLEPSCGSNREPYQQSAQ